MQKSVVNRVFDAFERGRKVVFPNEEARRRFVMQYVLSRRRALLESQSVAFDSLYESMLVKDPAFEEVREEERMVFSYSLIDNYSSSLSYFVNSEYQYLREESAKSIERILVYLKDILSDKSSFKDGELLRELEFIYEKYCKFLADSKRYEKSYLEVSLDGIEDYVFLLPYSNRVEASFFDKHSELKEAEIIDEGDDIDALYVFENERIEIRELFLRIRDLIESGVYLDDIAISVADIERLHPILEREALMFDIPLSFVGGKALKDLFPGKLIRDLESIYENNYSIKYLKAFFLNPIYRFEDREGMKEFIYKAIERGITSSPSLSSIRKGAEDRYSSIIVGDSGFKYSSFRKALDILFSLKDPDKVSMSFQVLLSSLFGKYRFEDDGKKSREFSFFQDMLDSSLDAIKGLSDSGYSEDISIFKEVTGRILSHRYVDRERDEGISVYPVELGYSSPYRYHFVINLTEGSLNTSLDSSSLFNEYISSLVDLKSEDFTDRLLSSYISVNENTEFYSAYHTTSGDTLPLSKLMGRLKRRGIDLPDSWENENRADDERSGYVFSLQREGALRAERAMDRGELSSSRKGIEDPKPKISFSSFEDYRKCHQFYILNRGKHKLNEPLFEGGADNLEIGNRMHSILERYYRELKSGNRERDLESFFDEEMETWKRGLRFKYSDEDDKEITIEMEKGSLTPDDGYISYIRNTYYEGLKSVVLLIESESDVREDDELERPMTVEMGDYTLNGKADRIATLKDSRRVFYDYKLSDNKFTGKDFEDKKNQFFVYKLLSGDKEAVGKFAFIKSGKFSKEVELSDTSEIEKELKGMAEGLKSGDWSLTDDLAECTSCPFKGVCRRRISPR